MEGNRPKVKQFKRPVNISDYPTGPSYTAGHLADTNASWRTFKPVINEDACIGCMKCYIVCPDGVVFKKGKKVDIDYDYCKGCGICAHECPVNAIEMVKEEL